jgi:hypothetical protein
MLMKNFGGNYIGHPADRMDIEKDVAHVNRPNGEVSAFAEFFGAVVTSFLFWTSAHNTAEARKVGYTEVVAQRRYLDAERDAPVRLCLCVCVCLCVFLHVCVCLPCTCKRVRVHVCVCVRDCVFTIP